MPNTATQLRQDTSHVLENETEFLDQKLKKYVRHRLRTLGRHRIGGESTGDIANATWARVLPQTPFLEGCTGVRVSYLKKTANNYIRNLVRTESQRPKALHKNWDKVLINHTAVRAEDVWDHIAIMLGALETGDRRSLVAPVFRRFNPDETTRDFIYAVWRLLYVAWCDIGGGDHAHRCHQCRYRWHRCWRYSHWHGSSGCCHPICQGMRHFASHAPSIGVADALKDSVGLVLSQVSTNVATCKGEKHERHCCCSDCCCCCCNC